MYKKLVVLLLNYNQNIMCSNIIKNDTPNILNVKKSETNSMNKSVNVFINNIGCWSKFKKYFCCCFITKNKKNPLLEKEDDDQHIIPANYTITTENDTTYSKLVAEGKRT